MSKHSEWESKRYSKENSNQFQSFSLLQSSINIFLILNLFLSVIIIVDLFIPPISEKAIVERIDTNNHFLIRYADYDWSNLALPKNKEDISLDDSLVVNFSPIFHTRISYCKLTTNGMQLFCSTDISYGLPIFIVVLNIVVFLILKIYPSIHKRISEDWSGSISIWDHKNFYIYYLILVFIVPLVLNTIYWYKLFNYIISRI